MQTTEQLYKYSDYLGLDYFDNPTIILSIPSTLNDPFESNLSDDIINHLVKGLKNTESLESKLKYIFSEYLGLTGIVSMSETSRNSLMWSHYSKHHKGMCIGISKEFLNHKEGMTYHYSNNFNIHAKAKPSKINYDNKRFEGSEHNDIKTEDLVGGKTLNEYLQKHLMIKGDEWIYEKEHRAIIPLAFSDGIMIIDNNTNKILTRLISGMFTSNEIEGSEKYRVEGPKPNKTYFFKSTDISSEFATLACDKRYNKANGIIFLLKINPKDIQTIHLGHRFCESEVDKIVKKISAPEHPLKHVRIYKKIISSTRFELESKQIYPAPTESEDSQIS